MQKRVSTVLEPFNELSFKQQNLMRGLQQQSSARVKEFVMIKDKLIRDYDKSQKDERVRISDKISNSSRDIEHSILSQIADNLNQEAGSMQSFKQLILSYYQIEELNQGSLQSIIEKAWKALETTEIDADFTELFVVTPVHNAAQDDIEFPAITLEDDQPASTPLLQDGSFESKFGLPPD